MQTDKTTEALLRVPLLEGLKAEQIARIARHAEKLKFRAGDMITKAGEPGNGAYVIVSGVAERAATPGSAAAAQPIEAGSVIGELAMLVEHTYGATIMARERVLCLRITRAAMHAQMQSDRSLAEHLSDHIRRRLAHVAEELRRIDEALVPREAPAPAVAHEDRGDQGRPAISTASMPFQTMRARQVAR